MSKHNLDRGFDFDKIDTSLVRNLHQNSKQKPLKSLLKQSEQDLSKDAIIDIIFQKMQQKGGFPSFSKHISDINKILRLKYASAKDIANVIIKDFSLSNKLLKLVNSSFYGQFSHDGISSIEKAIIILGADQVQQAAASLMLFDNMQANSYSKELKAIALKTFMGGLIAKEIATQKHYKDTEEFLICSMFYKLGENLVAYYFPEKRKVIEMLSDNSEVSNSMASHAVIGISYQKLGIGIGEKWGLPKNIVKSMCVKKPIKSPTQAFTHSRIELLGTLASLSNELCEIQFKTGNVAKQKDIKKMLMLYHDRLGISNEMIRAILKDVYKKLKAHSSQLNINIESFDILSDI